MSKKCLRCGCDLSNDNILYCPKCCDELYKPKKRVEVDEETIGKVKSVLNIIAKVTLILGTIAAIILFFVGFDKYSDYGIGIELIIASIVLLISSVITWATLKVFCNISNNLQEINKKMKG